MIIEKIAIKGFGGLNQTTIGLKPGLNIIYGRNEAGKSTICNYITGMLYGIDKMRGKAAKNDLHARYQPLNGGYYGGTMDFWQEGTHYRLQRSFDRFSKEVHLFDVDTGREIPLPEEKLCGVLFAMTKENYQNTYCMRQQEIKISQSLSHDLSQYMSNLSNTGSIKLDVKKAIEYLQSEKRANHTRDITEQMERISFLIKEKEDREEYLLALCEEEKHLKQELYHKEEELEEENLQKTPSIYLFLFLSIFLFVVFSIIWKQWWVGILAGVVPILYYYIQVQRNKVPKENLSESRSVLQLEGKKKLMVLEAEKEQVLKDVRLKEDLRQRYRNLKKQKEEMEYNNRAITMSMDALKKLASSIHDDFGGCLNEEVSEILSDITNGRYQNVKVDENLGILVEYKDNFIPIDYLSTGTAEQIYFSLRFASARILYPEETLPVLIDDIFGSYDKERLKETLVFLSRYPCEQIILFTCKEEIKELLTEEEAEFSYITL